MEKLATTLQERATLWQILWFEALAANDPSALTRARQRITSMDTAQITQKLQDLRGKVAADPDTLLPLGVKDSDPFSLNETATQPIGIIPGLATPESLPPASPAGKSHEEIQPALTTIPSQLAIEPSQLSSSSATKVSTSSPALPGLSDTATTGGSPSQPPPQRPGGPASASPEERGYPSLNTTVTITPGELSITNQSGAYLLTWTPATNNGGMGKAMVQIELAQRIVTDNDFRQLKETLIQEISKARRNAQGPLEGGIIKVLLRHGKITALENFEAREVILLGNRFADKVQIRHVKLIDSFIEIGGGLYNSDRRVELTVNDLQGVNSALALGCNNSTFEAFVLDKTSTLQGDLGSSIIKTSCRLQCYAVETNFLGVSWEGFGNTPQQIRQFRERFKGLKFSWNKIDHNIFANPNIARDVTEEQLRLFQAELNSNLPPRKIMAVLRNLGDRSIIVSYSKNTTQTKTQHDGSTETRFVNVARLRIGRDYYQLLMPHGRHLPQPCELYQENSQDDNLLTDMPLRHDAIFTMGTLYSDWWEEEQERRLERRLRPRPPPSGGKPSIVRWSQLPVRPKSVGESEYGEVI